MTNLARGSVILALVGTLIFNFAETKTEAANTIANDSKGSIQQNAADLNSDSNNAELKTEPLSENDSTFKEIDNLIDSLSSSTAASKDKNSKARSFNATAYCLKGRTATGGSVKRGIVAADPRVLPLGTRITLSAGSYSGNYVVADTGGGVRGRRLDIWVSSCSEARRFGRRSVTVNM